MKPSILNQYLIILLIAIVLGCEKTPSSFNMKFTNKSKNMMWVENAFYGKGDVGCGVLKPNASAEQFGPVRPNHVFPNTIEVVWWNGDRDSRPADESQFARQTVAISQPIAIGSNLQIWIEFGEDEVWRQVIPQDSDDD